MSTLKEQLDANIPRNVISSRSQGGKSLSYLETWYVIDRLNAVLGTDNWSWQIKALTSVAGTEKTTFVCHGTIQANIGGVASVKDGIGYGSDKGTFNPGEMAAKEAESDALKRAAMKFGRSLGLALYDKTQEYVDDAQPTDATVKSSEIKEDTGNKIPTKRSIGNSAKAIREQIKTAFGVLQAQKKVTKEDFVKTYLNGAKADDLTDDQAMTTITMIKSQFPELGL